MLLKPPSYSSIWDMDVLEEVLEYISFNQADSLLQQVDILCTAETGISPNIERNKDAQMMPKKYGWPGQITMPSFATSCCRRMEQCTQH
jgi:hypothetical protein